MFVKKEGLLATQEIEWFSRSIERHFELAREQVDGTCNVLVAASSGEVPDLAQFVAWALHRRLEPANWVEISGTPRPPPYRVGAKFGFLLGDAANPPFAPFIMPDHEAEAGRIIAKCRYYFQAKGAFEGRLVVYDKRESGAVNAIARFCVDDNMAIVLPPRLNLGSEPLARGRHGFIDLLLIAC